MAFICRKCVFSVAGMLLMKKEVVSCQKMLKNLYFCLKTMVIIINVAIPIPNHTFLLLA